MAKKYSEILLVDDDPVSNFLNQDLLSGLEIGEQIVVKDNGKAALNYVQAHWLDGHAETNPRLILLDLNMPQMNGFEFLDHLSGLPLGPVSIFLLTSSENPRDRQKASQYPIAGYLVKPLEGNSQFMEELKS